MIAELSAVELFDTINITPPEAAASQKGRKSMASHHSRRSFVTYSAGSFFLWSLAIKEALAGLEVVAGLTPGAIRVGSRRPIAPLFCLAYITPDAPGQSGQEAIVAKYPVAVVPQDERRSFRKWRDRVRAINPNIVLLGYQMVHEETSDPGPGHDELRKATHSWCRHPDGFEPFTSWGNTHHRLLDPRTREFEEYFLRACRAVLGSYDFDGLFLDNCTVFPIAHPDDTVRSQMRQALQVVLLKLRAEFPGALIVGNSSENWVGLNGEMNEGRPAQLQSELRYFGGHTSPSMDMYQTILTRTDDTETVRREMRETLSLGALYGANVESTHVLWFEDFDKVIGSFKEQHS